MRGRLAGTLVLVASVVGVAMAPAPMSTLSTLEHGSVGAVLAAPAQVLPAARPADVGGGLIRKGPFINNLSSPTITVQVLAKYDIFLAGLTYPSLVQGRLGKDLAGPNSPACLRVLVPRSSIIRISTAHGTADAPIVSPAKDANGRVSAVILAGPAERGSTKVGLSSIKAPIDGLVGVFLGAKPNRGKAPPTLDYSSPRVRDAQMIRPALNQVFFIGNGLTSKGKRKQIVTPAGATQICFAPLNHVGASVHGRGVILAFVTGNESIPNGFTLPSLAPTGTVTRTPPVSATATFTTTVFPTDTATNTRLPTKTPVPFTSVLVNGTPVLLNAQGTPVNAQGTPIVLTNAQGTPINAQGSPIAAGGGAGGGGGGAGGGGGGAGGGGGGTGGGGAGTPGAGTPGAAGSGTVAPSGTATPTVTTTPTATISATPTTTPTGLISTGVGIPITMADVWGHFQFDESHPGYITDLTRQGNPNPNNNTCARPGNVFCVQNMALQWVSTPIADLVTVSGPVVGLENLYYATSNGAVHCIDANTAYANILDQRPCRDGFSTVSLGPNNDDNVPVVNPGANILWVLSHNPPAPFVTSVTDGQIGGSLTAYNASTGAGVPGYNGPATIHPLLPTSAGVPLTVHNNVCYVPTLPYAYPGDLNHPAGAAPAQLHFLNCGAASGGVGQNGDGTELLPCATFPANGALTLGDTPLSVVNFGPPPPCLPAGGVITLNGGVPGTIPLAGAVIDPVNNLIIVAETNGASDIVEAFCDWDVGAGTPACPQGAGNLHWSVTLPGGATTPSEAFQPIVGTDPIGTTTTYVAFPGGMWALNNATGSTKWQILTGVPPTFFAGAPPAVQFTGFNPTSMPAFNPTINTLYVGANVIIGSTTVPAEVAIFANNGTVNGTPVTGGEVRWDFTQAGLGTMTGPPVSDNGTTPLGVVFAADNVGNVLALDANIGTFLKGFSGAQNGSTLVVIDGHLFFAGKTGGLNANNPNGSILNYSEPPS